MYFVRKHNRGEGRMRESKLSSMENLMLDENISDLLLDVWYDVMQENIGMYKISNLWCISILILKLILVSFVVLWKLLSCYMGFMVSLGLGCNVCENGLQYGSNLLGHIIVHYWCSLKSDFKCQFDQKIKRDCISYHIWNNVKTQRTLKKYAMFEIEQKYKLLVPTDPR